MAQVCGSEGRTEGEGVVPAVERDHRHLYYPVDLEHVALLVKDRRHDARRPQLESDEADTQHFPLSGPAEDVLFEGDRGLAGLPRPDHDLLARLLDCCVAAANSRPYRLPDWLGDIVVGPPVQAIRSRPGARGGGGADTVLLARRPSGAHSEASVEKRASVEKSRGRNP